jgi:hypothetical protein
MVLASRLLEGAGRPPLSMKLGQARLFDDFPLAHLWGVGWIRVIQRGKAYCFGLIVSAVASKGAIYARSNVGRSL